MTSTDIDVQFKLKLKKNLTLIMSGKYVLHLLANTKYIHGTNYPYTNHMYVVQLLPRNNSNNESQVSIMLR